MDVKRTVITLVLITAVWFAWWNWFQPKPPALPPTPQAQPTAAQPSSAAAADAGAEKAAAPAQVGSAEKAPPAAEKPAEEKIALETNLWKATLSSYGGTVVGFELKDPQYREASPQGERQVELVKTPKQPPFATVFQTKDLAVPADAVWKIEARSDREITFAWEGPAAKVIKRYSTVGVSSGYDLGLLVEIQNRKGQPIAVGMQLLVPGWHDFHGPKGGIFKPPPNLWEAACYHGERTQQGFDTIAEDGPFEARPDAGGAAQWAGVMDRYFLLGAATAPSAAAVAPGCRLEITNREQGILQASLLFGAKEIAADKTEQYRFAVYGGPKLLRELDATRVPGANADPLLGKAVDYGVWGPISRVMLGVLVVVHRTVGSWGLAIIALTLLVKLLTFPLTQKSIRAGREMAKLKPKMEELQKRYKDDKQRLNQEVMNLYKTHGVNPIGSCLPMLIQLPVWWALYSTLNNAVELYRSTFLWMPDLTQPDPYYITPVAMGGFMFLQQKITPMPTDSEQQRIMMYTMPVVFTLMSLLFPAGLTVYILTNTLLSMLQQWLGNRSGDVLTPARAK